MTEISQRLRNACDSVRAKSYPLSDLIPLMQQAADALDAAVLAQPVAAEGWQPIETAPEIEGVEVWLHEDRQAFRGCWAVIPFKEFRDADGCFIDQQDPDAYWLNFDTGERCNPSDWMPFTPPPTPA